MDPSHTDSLTPPLWGLHPDPAVRDAVAGAHRAGVADAVAYLEENAVWARRGNGGTRRVEVGGLVAAAFEHRLSREGDPQLHTHVVAANMVRDHAGRWSAPDGRAIYQHAKTAGFVYQAALRRSMTASLGVGWGPVRNGMADVAGIDRSHIEAFSTRRHQITTALAERGLSSSNAARAATLATRRAKGGEPVELGARWRAAAANMGLDVTGIDRTIRPATVEQPRAVEGVLDELGRPTGLTANTSAFNKKTVVRGLAEALPDGATWAELRHLTAAFTARDDIVDLGPTDVADRQRWTTLDLLTVEADLARLARNGVRAGTATATPDAVGAALRDRPQLSEEQADLVRAVTTGGHLVACVVGKPGTGKTFALDAARAALTGSGVPVVGTALAARAAAGLEAGSGIPSTTLARLLADIARPEGRLAAGTVVVVDEAGMVGTRDLHRLVSLVADQAGRVVLVGDPAQLPEIAAGGAFARLAHTAPCSTLSANRRQEQAWERAALDRLRDRQPTVALAAYGTHGRVTVADTSPARSERMVADWHHHRTDGETTVMLAVRRDDVADLNRAAQTLRIACGELDPATAIPTPAGPVLVGDEVVCGRNDRRAGLLNGTRLTVTGPGPDGGIAAIDAAGRPIVVPGGYVARGHLTLGYATTVHKAQGQTVDRALLFGDDRLFAEAGYVGLSRGRHANQLYVVAQHRPAHQARDLPGTTGIDHVCKALGVSQAQSLSTDQLAGQVPDLPLDRLVADRDRLTRTLTTSMPFHPHDTLRSEDLAPGLVGQELAAWDRWTAEHRRDGEHLARLTAGVDRRIDHLTTAAMADPPSHLVRLLGPLPDDRAGRDDWANTAAALEAWREVSGRSPTSSSHLLAEPRAGTPPHAWWADATRRLDRHQERLLRTARRADTPDPVPDLDRSWTNNLQKGLSR